MVTLSQSGVLSSKSVAALIGALESRDTVQRIAARQGLQRMGKAAVVPLVQKLSDPHDLTVWEAAKALEAIADPAAAKALVEALDHGNPGVCWVAAEALVALDREGAQQVLMALLTHADSVWLRKGAHHVLSIYAQHHSAEFLRPLLALFGGFEPGVTIPPAALDALHELDRV